MKFRMKGEKSAYQFAREECANMVAGKCQRMSLDHACADHSVPEARGGACALAAGEPCEYFSKVVAPVARRMDVALILPSGVKVSGRPCPFCGSPMPPRWKFCADCMHEGRGMKDLKVAGGTA